MLEVEKVKKLIIKWEERLSRFKKSKDEVYACTGIYESVEDRVFADTRFQVLNQCLNELKLLKNELKKAH